MERIHRFRQTDAWLYSVVLVSAAAALWGSLVLSVEAIELAVNPSASLTCNVNQAISCGTVGTSWQAHLLGFPNAYLGLVTEPVFIVVAVAALWGTRFPRTFMLGVQVLVTGALLFAYWLLTQSLFVIGALCPWCLLVMFATTITFVAVTHINVRDDNLFLPRKIQSALSTAIRLDLDLLATVLWLVLICVVIFAKYGTALFA